MYVGLFKQGERVLRLGCSNSPAHERRDAPTVILPIGNSTGRGGVLFA